MLLIIVYPVVVSAETVDLYSSSWDKGVVVVLYGSKYGTGWWVNEHYVVTAAHVMDYSSNVEVSILHGDYKAVGEVVYIDEIYDIAIIRVDNPPSQQYVFKLSLKSPSKGDTIFVIGYPYEIYRITKDLKIMSATPRVVQGIIAWVYPDENIFEFSAPTDAGNSGGPIVNENGEVVGLVSFALKGEAATMYYASDVNTIKQACDKAGVKYYVSLGSSVDSLTEKTENPWVIAAVAGAGAGLVSTFTLIHIIRGKRR